MPDRDDSPSGHRQRLRELFLASGALGVTESDLLELLLTYAIPRRDVAPLARHLLESFGNLPGVLAASHEELLAVPGVGEQTAILVEVVSQMTEGGQVQVPSDESATEQLVLTTAEPGLEPVVGPEAELEAPSMRTFTNDLSTAALEYIPQIVDLQSIEAFRDFLEHNLPYNSLTSRKRYASNLINRYYSEGSVDTPLTTFLGYKPALDTWRSVLFYETVRVEPTVKLVAEDIVWPAVPAGYLTRSQLRERLETVFPQVSTATMKRMLYALFNVYTHLNRARTDDDVLRFQVHRGTIEAFLYVLTAEFPEPGMYRFEELEQGPMRHWLLWDREWMHQQIYNVRDFGILSKVSQIDTLRQFTLQYDQTTALRHYFEHPERESLALRERARNRVSSEKPGF